MDKVRNKVTKRILNLTLEIIYLLTGEDYTVVKTTSGECVAPSSSPHVSGGWSQSPTTDPPPPSLIPERNNEQKILDLTHKIIELLTGEECIYSNGHKDVMMENNKLLIPTDESINNTRRPSPLCSQEGPEGNRSVGEDHQTEDFYVIKVEAVEEDQINIKDEYQYKQEKFPIGIGPDGQKKSLESPVPSPPAAEGDPKITQEPLEEKIIIQNLTSAPHRGDLSYPSKQEEPSAAQSHTSSYHIISCSQCGKLHQSHIAEYQTHHPRGKLYFCSECGKCVSPMMMLISDDEIHKGQRLFPAEQQRLKTGAMPYVCAECTKCLTRRVPRDEKPFQCSECGKYFSQKSSLVEHQRIHTGERPFPCSECGKCFTKKSALVKHLRFHSGEKPFSCSECGKRFTQKSDLVNHLRIHTGEKPFACSECGKCFTQKSNLVEHQRIHTEERPFTCSECGKGFNHRSNLLKHQAVHTQ